MLLLLLLVCGFLEAFHLTPAAMGIILLIPLCVNFCFSKKRSVNTIQVLSFCLQNSAVRYVDTLNTSTALIRTVVGLLGQHGASGDGGPATNATLRFPQTVIMYVLFALE